jgi:hypothetical protein
LKFPLLTPILLYLRHRRLVSGRSIREWWLIGE